MKWTDRIGRRLKLNDLQILMIVAESAALADPLQTFATTAPVQARRARSERPPGAPWEPLGNRTVAHDCSSLSGMVLKRGAM